MPARPVKSEPHVTATARLRPAGQRYTSNRRAIVEVLDAAAQPLTIVEILERRPDLALSSVYRNLAVLEAAGVVRRLLTSGEFARFELTEDLTQHHHHAICSSCGAVEDFHVSPGLERSLHRATQEVAGRLAFTPQAHRLDVVGLCRRCA